MPPTPDTNPISLSDIVDVLRRRRSQIAMTFILTLAGVAAATYAMPKQYESHMKVLVKNERADMVVSTSFNCSGAYSARCEVVISATGLPPVSCSQWSIMIWTSEPTWRDEAVQSKPM